MAADDPALHASGGLPVDQVQLSAQRVDGAVVVTVRGELDVLTSPQLDECLADARREAGSVILDLSGVEFLDTSALAVIIGHWKKLSAAGRTLALAGARYEYTKTLWITGLAERLPTFATAAEAVEAYRAARPGIEKPGQIDADRK